MKVSIEGFSQEAAIALSKTIEEITYSIDCIDLVILRWFVDFYPEMKKVEMNGKQYALLSYNKIENDLPILAIKRRAIADRLSKLVKLEVLDSVIDKEEGNRTYFAFGKNYHKMLENRGGMLFKQQGCCLNDKVVVQTPDINIIVGNNLSKNNIDSTNYNKSSTTSISYKEDNNLYSSNNNLYISNTNNSDPFVEFWESYPSTRRKVDKKRCETAFRLLTEEEKERAIKALELWKKTDDWKKNNGQYIPAPLVYLHQKRWDGILKETEQRQEKFESNIEAWKKLGLM